VNDHLRLVDSLAAEPTAAEWALRARIGMTIRLRRRRKGWTQEWLANQVGTTQTTISHIETGQRWFGSASLMLSIFALCDMPMPWDETAYGTAQDHAESLNTERP
jgi:transcriptional regulator with XRE-family HTH domain